MKHHILAIGISKHKNSGANLGFAEKDASEFYNLFTDNISNIGYSRLLVDQEATLTEIKSALGKELSENITKDDAFIFFYSGHGALVTNPSDPDVALNYLVPYDATGDIANSCLSVDDFKMIFEHLPSKVNLIFIDSCFSGAVGTTGKNYPMPNKKSFKTVKSFANTVVGNGSLIFTACKDDEEAIEDQDYQNGLFTHFVLDELQKDHADELYSVMNIFGPIADGVTDRAYQTWSHKQTPTLSGKLEGDLKLPLFKKRLQIKPERLELPKTPELDKETFTIPVMDISEEENARLIQDTIDFVVNSSAGTNKVATLLGYEKFCMRLTNKIKTEWENIFQDSGQDAHKIPDAVSMMEAQCYQMMILGVTTAVYGNDELMKIFSDSLVSILELTHNRAGLVSLVAVPEVIIIEAIYLIAVISIARSNYCPLKVLLNTKIDDPNVFDQPPKTLLENNSLHFTRALTGSAVKVNEHVQKYLKNQEWISEFAPKLENDTFNFQIQANLLLAVIVVQNGGYIWPEFARCYAERVMPFIKKIRFDKGVIESIAELMDVSPDEVKEKFSESLKILEQRGLDRYHWTSIRSDIFNN